MSGSIPELQQLTDKSYNCKEAYGMEVSLEKSKIMVNKFSNSHSNSITMNGETLETVDKFKYLGATLTKDEKSEKEIQIILATANSALVNLNTIWKSISFLLRSNIHVYKSLILSILLYGCETWILNETLEKRINAFESKSYRRIIGISYRERKMNYYVFKTII